MRAVLDTVRTHGANVAADAISRLAHAVNTKSQVPIFNIKESFFEEIINIGKIGGCQISPHTKGVLPHTRYQIDTKNHTGYFPPVEVEKFVKATNRWYGSSVSHMNQSKLDSYSQHEAIPYMFNLYGRDLQNVFTFCEWNNFDFNKFYVRLEKYINDSIKQSENIEFNTYNTLQVTDFIEDFIKAGLAHGAGISTNNIGGMVIETAYVKGIYQFTFNYKDVKSDYMSALTNLIKKKEYRAKSVTFSPIKMILVREPKGFDGNKPVYR
jgi:hypothetical protein